MRQLLRFKQAEDPPVGFGTGGLQGRAILDAGKISLVQFQHAVKQVS
jgi:hypothetical protein